MGLEIVCTTTIQGLSIGGRDALQLVLRTSLVRRGGPRRLLHFDVAIDGRNDVQDGWLSVTHCLTSSEALRVAVARFEGPELLRALESRP